MTHVKVQDGAVSEFPYSIAKLKEDNPSVSFPASIPETTLAEYGVYPVQPAPQPVSDPLVQQTTRGNPTLTNSQWFENWTVSNIDEARAKANVREERDRLLADTDHHALSDQTLSTEMSTYRQALRDITSQSGFPFSVTWPTKP